MKERLRVLLKRVRLALEFLRADALEFLRADDHYIVAVIRGTSIKTGHIETLFVNLDDARAYLDKMSPSKRAKRTIVAVPLNG